MTRRTRRSRTAVAARRNRRRPSRRARFARVMRELERASTTGKFVDPLVERLRQCPDTFRAGEMLGKMFDEDSEGDERYLPPPGIAMPLF